MSFAICLQVLNHLHFKRPELIWAEFLPQILFMESIFGYLVVCIVYKWSVDWEQAGAQPPDLLNMLIKMFLSPGNVRRLRLSLARAHGPSLPPRTSSSPSPSPPTSPLSSRPATCPSRRTLNGFADPRADPRPQIEEGKQLYRGQAFVQVVLLLVALVCVPWMLCTRPYLEYREMQKIKEQGYHGIGNGHASSSGEDETDGEDGVGAHEGHAVAMTEEAEEEGHDLGEIIIHQVIRASASLSSPLPLARARRLTPRALTLADTIEFCLGCISNTASYLRLWALSLAHAQLSEVLWSMTLARAFTMEGTLAIPFTFFMFAMWFTLTIAMCVPSSSGSSATDDGQLTLSLSAFFSCSLCVMEGLSAFLHALRLHWVEFNSKFFVRRRLSLSLSRSVPRPPS